MEKLKKYPTLRFRGRDGKQYPNWEEIKLKDLLDVRDERQIPSEEAPLMAFTSTGGVEEKGDRYNREFLVKDENKKYKRTELNDLIYSSNNLDVGAIGRNKYGTAVISDVYEIFKPRENTIPEFMEILIRRRSFLNSVLKYRQGALYGQYRIHANDFLDVTVIIPSLEEQEKIASFFSLIDQKIEKQQEMIEQLELFKKGILQKIFSQELRFKDENGQEFPEWSSSVLEELGSFIRNYSFSRSIEGEGEYHHIHYGDIHSKFSGVITSQTEIPSLSVDTEATYTLLEDGDVVFADASEDTSDLGKSVVLLEVDNRKIIGGLHTHCFRPDSRLDPLFLHFFTQTVEYRKFINVNANGVSVFGLSKPALASLEVPLPYIKEQQKISSFLYKLSRKIELLRMKKIELEVMKKGFMSQMFI